jgi:hypothetical protein
MSRASYRGGRAPILTPTQLSEWLPLPVYLMATGHASPFFPSTCRAHASESVVLELTGSLPDSYKDNGVAQRFPLHFHWTQWRDVVVPVVADPRILSWAGKLEAAGDTLTLPVDIYGPGKTVVIAAGQSEGTTALSTAMPSGLYVGEVNSYMNEVRKIILAQANSV